MAKNDALKLEYRIKQLPARKKIFEFTKGKGTMAKNIEKDLMAINEEVKAVAKRIEERTKAIGNLEKANPANQSCSISGGSHFLMPAQKQLPNFTAQYFPGWTQG